MPAGYLIDRVSRVHIFNLAPSLFATRGAAYMTTGNASSVPIYDARALFFSFLFFFFTETEKEGARKRESARRGERGNFEFRVTHMFLDERDDSSRGKRCSDSSSYR